MNLGTLGLGLLIGTSVWLYIRLAKFKNQVHRGNLVSANILISILCGFLLSIIATIIFPISIEVTANLSVGFAGLSSGIICYIIYFRARKKAISKGYKEVKRKEVKAYLDK